MLVFLVISAELSFRSFGVAFPSGQSCEHLVVTFQNHVQANKTYETKLIIICSTLENRSKRYDLLVALYAAPRPAHLKRGLGHCVQILPDGTFFVGCFFCCLFAESQLFVWIVEHWLQRARLATE